MVASIGLQSWSSVEAWFSTALDIEEVSFCDWWGSVARHGR